MFPELDAFAKAHGLTVAPKPTKTEHAATGSVEGRTVHMSQGSIVHPRSGGKLFHYRLLFEPYVRSPSWLLTPTTTTRWEAGTPTPAAREDVPGWAKFSAPLLQFGDEVKTHWQLKLDEAGKLYLEALELVSPRAWELAWATLDAVWGST
ncbi:MAG: hypothetical protein JNK82_33040 [Myxococcaceae bacterium]|nr:hypothetical protein [Myxococcaceae bacterium]